MDVTVVVATFGDQEWINLAHRRAIPSAVAEGVEVIHRHGTSLAQARNEGLGLVRTEWVIHLDADDELEPGYVEEMARGSADLRAPAVSYVRKFRQVRPAGLPKVAGHDHDCTAECLPAGNWLVIGTAVRAEMAREIGWREYACYEDWDFFQRCWLAGATVEAIPDAVYRAHVRFDSRNRAPDISFKNRVHHEIMAANFPT